jgi:hypothetical protein
MHTDNLLEIKKGIEKYCKDNNIAIFYGGVEAENTPSVEWEADNSEDWKSYLDVSKQLNIKVLCLESSINNIEENETILTYYNSLEEDEKRDYNKALDIMKKTKGHVAIVSMSYFFDGVRYYFEQEAEWANAHVQVLEAYKYIPDDGDESDGDDKRLSEAEVNKFARMIIEEENYIKAKARDRHEIAREILQEKSAEYNLSEMGVFDVCWRAKKLFEKEMQPKLDKELEKTIKDLKSKGNSKAAVKGQLGITEGILNKFWYS